MDEQLKSTLKIEGDSPLLDQRLNNALDGLQPYFYDHLKNRISKTNATAIINYILAMRVETNLSGRPSKRCNYNAKAHIAISK